MDYFYIMGHNIGGYLKNIPSLYNKIKKYNPDIIHAHYGLSGLLAFLSFAKRLIVTYHGSDVNDARHRYFSKLVSHLALYNIFVEKSLAKKIRINKNYSIIPCGVNINEFHPIDKSIARKQLNLNMDKVIILFSSSFDRPVKNYSLAKQAINLISFKVDLIELKGYSRKEVMLLMNAADICLLTSLNEGSPQFVKEAMACNSPLVATDVGDIRHLFNNLDGYYISSYNVESVTENIYRALKFRNNNLFTAGRDRIIKLGLDNENIANQIDEIYTSLCSNNIDMKYNTSTVNNLTKSF